MELEPGFVEDARALEATASLPELVACASWPLFFLVGEEDSVFPIAETEELLGHANMGKAHFAMIEKAGHAFSADRASGSSSRAQKEVLAYLSRFLDSLSGRAPGIQEPSGSS